MQRFGVLVGSVLIALSWGCVTDEEFEEEFRAAQVQEDGYCAEATVEVEVEAEAAQHAEGAEHAEAEAAGGVWCKCTCNTQVPPGSCKVEAYSSCGQCSCLNGNACHGYGTLSGCVKK